MTDKETPLLSADTAQSPENTLVLGREIAIVTVAGTSFQLSFKRRQSRGKPSGSSSSTEDTIVLLHGTGLGLVCFEELAEALSATVNVISVDLFGHGYSDSPELPHDQDTVARAVRALLQQQQVQACYVCGHSSGAYVAGAYVMLFPGSCRGLVLLSPSGITLPPPTGCFMAMARSCSCFATLFGRLIASSMRSGAYKNMWKGTDDNFNRFKDLVEGDLAVYGRKWVTGMARWVAECRDYGGASGEAFFATVGGKLAETGIRALVLWGQHDDAAPTCDATTFKSILGAHLTVLDGHSHLFVVEAAEEVAHLIMDFWRKPDM